MRNNIEATLERLIEKTKEILSNSYAPYSRIHVAAAILTQNNEVFTGVNVENSSYGLTVCAERVAIFNAITNGARAFKALAIVTDFHEPLLPCGACLQVLAEFVDDIPIISCSTISNSCIKTTLKELMPRPFRL